MTGKRKGKRFVAADGSVEVRGKNANGHGSVYQRKDGRWEATWWVDGEQRPRVASGKTRDAAIRRRQQRQANYRSPADLSILGELADWWLENVAKGKVRPQTLTGYRNHVIRIKATLGRVDVRELNYATVVAWQARLLTEGRARRRGPIGSDGPVFDGPRLKPKTVREHRETLRQIVDQAVKMEMIPGNPVSAVDPPPIVVPDKDALDSGQIDALVHATRKGSRTKRPTAWSNGRLAGAVALLFKQGWRISEVMGLAVPDVDLDTGRAYVKRASVYITGVGQVLQPYPKEESTWGEYWLQPIVIDLIGERMEQLELEKPACPDWQDQYCDDQLVDLLFTKLDGRLLRIHDVDTAVSKAAEAAGLDAQLGTHGGRRSVVTALYSESDMAVDDIANYVGHATHMSTRRYIKRLGKRPKEVSKRAGNVLAKGV